ncbi:MAG: NAD(P)H-dependent oxidoreductase [Methanomicrobiales archaeon]
MKIVVLNGSPKGDAGVTIQYIHYLERMIPEHQFIIHHVAHTIRALEKDMVTFDLVVNDIRASDGVIWAFPLYYLLVPSQFKRFIELVSERDAKGAFENKYTAAFSTSIHFFDHTAHNYIHAVCDDLGMHYNGFFSSEMEDGKYAGNREKLLYFARDFLSAIIDQRPCQKVYPPLVHEAFSYIPRNRQESHPAGGKKIVIVTDESPEDSNLNRMIEYFRGYFSDLVPVYRLQDVKIRGGCIGCIQCGPDNCCVYQDGYADFFNSVLVPADIIIIAGKIHDRYLSAKWKEFFDRSFFRGHTPSFEGAQIGYMVSGPLAQLPNLREILEAYAENQHANPSFITDEPGDTGDLDRMIGSFAGTILAYAQAGYVRPPTYLSVGGRKIFRDAVFGRLRFPFLADHAYYRQHGYYDFPQGEYRVRMRNAIMGLLMYLPAVQREYKKRSMIEPGKHVSKLLDNSSGSTPQHKWMTRFPGKGCIQGP